MSLATLAASLMVVIPGLGASIALWGPRRLSLPTRLATVAALGFVVDGLLALVLALVHGFHAVPFFGGLAAVTGVLWIAGLRRAGLREHWRAAREEVRADRLPILAGLAVMGGFIVVRLTYPSLVHLWNATSWRYWADGVEIAELGRIPAATLQYGALSPTVVNKVLLNSFSGGLELAIGPEALPALAALLFVSSVGLALALWSLGHELGLRRTAALLPLLLIANGLFLNTELTADLQAHKAEAVGRAVALCAAALAVRALRRPHPWKDAVVAGALLGAAATIHLVPVMIAGALIAWFAAARLLLDREPAAIALRGLGLAAVAMSLCVGILLLSGGDAALGGASTEEPAAADFGPGFDPTLFLKEGLDVTPGSGPHPWYLSPATSAKSFTAGAIGIPVRSEAGEAAAVSLAWLLAVGGAVGALVLLRRGPPGLRPLGLVAWGTAATIVAVTWLLSYRALYVPATFGLRRLFDYSSLPLVLALLVLVELGLARLASPSAGPAWGAILTVAAAALLLPFALPPAYPEAAERGLLAGFRWLRSNLPCDVRILADQHTEGVFEAMGGRVAILEGPTPYLRPDVLPGVVRLLQDAGAFFEDPRANRSFLAGQRVTHVVSLKHGVVGYPVAAMADPAALLALPDVRAVYLSPAVDVYEVSGSRPSPLPRGARDAFVPCLREPPSA